MPSLRLLFLLLVLHLQLRDSPDLVSIVAGDGFSEGLHHAVRHVGLELVRVVEVRD